MGEVCPFIAQFLILERKNCYIQYIHAASKEIKRSRIKNIQFHGFRFKLASNSSLPHVFTQVEIYEAANCSEGSLVVIFYFTEEEYLPQAEGHGCLQTHQKVRPQVQLHIP